MSQRQPEVNRSFLHNINLSNIYIANIYLLHFPSILNAWLHAQYPVVSRFFGSDIVFICLAKLLEKAFYKKMRNKVCFFKCWKN